MNRATDGTAPDRSSADSSTSHKPRVGLVLGGGGVAGAAYHAGALAAIEYDLGWDPQTADIVVGTSAGSPTGALLRLGVAASDLAALTVGAKAHTVNIDQAARLADRPVSCSTLAP